MFNKKLKFGNFREDLFHRLNVFNIKIDPLNKRIDDIPILIDYFIENICEANNFKKFKIIDNNYLLNYDWPGNVRELRNLIERIAILSPGDDNERLMNIIKESLSKSIEDEFSVTETLTVPLKEARESFEKQYLISQLKKFSGNISKTAKFIGMERSALHRKLKLLRCERFKLMNIIICGAGRVGSTIAKMLIEQNHSITMIDQSSDDIQKINETLDVKAIVGKATSPAILEKANTKDADMIIAVTRNDEINMLICQIAFSLFQVPKKIARIRFQEYLDPKYSGLFNRENLPIDYIISPEIEIAKSIQRKLEAPGALDNVPFAENKIRLLEILIDEKCSIHGINLNELTKKFPKLNAYILGVIRNDKFVIMKKTDQLQLNDKAYVVVNSSQMQETLTVFGHNEKISNKMLIIGGGNIGFNLAKNIEQSFDSARVKIIEKDKI